MPEQSKRFLIRGGRVYSHEGDVHQPAVADILIDGGKIERVHRHIDPEPAVEVIASGSISINAVKPIVMNGRL